MSANEIACRRTVKARATSYDDSLVFGDWLPCEYCGSFTSRPEMHHRLFRSRGGLWTPSNVILLCPEHHLDTTNERLGGTGLNCQSWESPNEVPVEVWYEDGAVFLDDEGGYRLIG